VADVDLRSVRAQPGGGRPSSTAPPPPVPAARPGRLEGLGHRLSLEVAPAFARPVMGLEQERRAGWSGRGGVGPAQPAGTA